MTAVGKLGIPSNMDAWDGYPAARERLYGIAREAGAKDLLVITGDTHVFWQNRLIGDAGLPEDRRRTKTNVILEQGERTRRFRCSSVNTGLSSMRSQNRIIM